MNCKEVSRSVSGEEAVSGTVSRILLRFHMLICSNCRRYAEQISRIGRASKNLFVAGRESISPSVELLKSILDRIPGENDRTSF